MITYLTSNPGGCINKEGKCYPACLSEMNHFVGSLKENWRARSKILIISSNPDTIEINDSFKSIFEQAFSMSGLSIDRVDWCDSRNTKIVEHIMEYDVVMLAGGHVPTQNKFFHDIDLKKWIQTFDGIVIGISAGTMNCAKVVYAQPELEGETQDHQYHRFINGLGITKLMILPHYHDIKDEMLDGKRIIEDITYPDSMGREFYAIPDGSYIMVKDGKTTLYGEGYVIQDGETRKICEQGDCLSLD